MTHKNEANPELLMEIEQLKQSLTELQSLLDTANHELIRLEYELTKAKQKAEETEHLNYAELTCFCHEIRTPINGIFGFSELLKDPNITVEERQKFIEVIINSGHSMLNIINAELEFLKHVRNQNFIP